MYHRAVLVGRTPSSGLAPSFLAAGLALVVRLALTFSIGINPSFFDADSYHALALAALRGAPVETLGHPPGYTWLLISLYLLLGVRPPAVYLFQDLLSALSVFLVAHAVGRRWGARPALAAGLLMAVNAYLAVFPTVLASETVSTAGIAALVWLLVPEFPRVSSHRLLLAAVVAGSLAQVRTGFALFVPALVLLSLAPLLGARPRPAGKSVGTALLVAAVGSAIVAGPALFRSRETGVFRLGAQLDASILWNANNPSATGRHEPMPDEPAVGQPGIPDAEALDRVYRDRVLEFLLGRPWRQLDLVPRRIGLLLAVPKRDLIYLYGHGWAGERPPAHLWAFLGWLVASHSLLAAAALAGLLRAPDDPSLAAAGLVALVCVAPYLVTWGDARYLQPAYPALAFAAGGAFARGWTPLRGRRRILAWVLGGALAGNALVDLSASLPAVAAIARPGGSALRPAYHFAR